VSHPFGDGTLIKRKRSQPTAFSHRRRRPPFLKHPSSNLVKCKALKETAVTIEEWAIGHQFAVRSLSAVKVSNLLDIKHNLPLNWRYLVTPVVANQKHSCLTMILTNAET
jgi:hypothetical protein